MRTEEDEARFEEWWSNHSEIFIVDRDGDRLNCIKPSDDEERVLAKAAARSAWSHLVLVAAFRPG